MRTRILLISACLIGLTACETGLAPTPVPDYTIRVMSSSNGVVAIPPNCANWTTDTINPFDTEMLPQLGCATARNLAMMVENPNDLVHGRDMSASRSVSDVGSVRRYDNNQTRGLIWLSTDPNQVAATSAPTATSGITGDAYGNTGSK